VTLLWFIALVGYPVGWNSSGPESWG